MPSFASTDGPKSAVPIKNHRYQIPRWPFVEKSEKGDTSPTRLPDNIESVEGRGMLVPWTRVSTILDTHEDKEGIFKWTKRLVVKGLGAREDLYALAAATRLEDKAGLLKIADQAFDYAKGQAASNLGSALHGFLERWVEGDKDLTIPSQWKGDVGAVMTAFQAHNIRLRPDLQEMVVVRPDLKDGDAGGLAGRFDLVVEMLNPETGEWELIVADYKTGSDPLLYGSWKIQQQLGLYGTGWAVWDGTHWHPMPKIRRDKILMVHVLPGQASCQIHIGDVDPVALEEDLAAAYRTRRRRKEAKKAWRPLVTVEAGVIVDGQELNPTGGMEPDGIGEAARDRARMDAERAAATVARVAAESNPNTDGDDERAVQIANPSLGPDTARAIVADQELARVAAESNPNTDGDDEVPTSTHAKSVVYEPGRATPESVQHVSATLDRSVPTPGPGAEVLAPLAGPGERGCGVCGRKGHRRGSPKCLGENDPARTVQVDGKSFRQEPDWAARQDADRERQENGGPTNAEVADGAEPTWCRCTTRARGWAAPADGGDGPWVCGDCGLPSRAGQISGTGRPADPTAEVTYMDAVPVSAADITLEEHARCILSDARDRLDDDSQTTGDVAVLSGDEAEIRKWWTPNSDPDDETTEADLAAALLAGEMVRAERPAKGELHIGTVTSRMDNGDPDPFDEDGSDALTPAKPVTWLERIQAAESKADLRDIRAEALEVGEWTQELTAAGLERMKSFAPKG